MSICFSKLSLPPQMISQPSVAFHTLGCKLNFAETSAIGRQLRNSGFIKTAFESKADVYVINTCSVTENADRECRAVVRKALKNNPDAFIAVIGCYAQLKPEEISSIEGVDLVLGASEKFNLPYYLREISKKETAEIHSCEVDTVQEFISSYSTGDRTRAFLKVQDGCDYSCTYCTIPLARGASRSDSIENVVAQANEIASQGIKEIVLTGVNIGDFKNVKGENFLSLIKALDDVNGIERFRISSIEPNLLTDEIIEFVSSSKKFVPHFHIPLQSGSDKVLKLMRRRYLRELYSNRIAKIKSLMPECCIGVDVITGFPGETEDEFKETYRFLTDLDISYLHVFTYSERDRTEALNIKEVVPMNERRKRNKMLRILSQKKLHRFYDQHVGKTMKVMFETENKNGMLHGFTENYIKVKTEFDPALVRQVAEAELNSIDDDMEVVCNVSSYSLA
jgi:threonylcarbamoyladenosine tRNA methylthiotransferase MtaB